MIAAIYARKSTEQNGVNDEEMPASLIADLGRLWAEVLVAEYHARHARKGGADGLPLQTEAQEASG